MSLTPHDIARMLDHSTLQPFLTEDDIRRGCELALKYNTASVCARPCDVPILAEMLRGSDVKVCRFFSTENRLHFAASHAKLQGGEICKGAFLLQSPAVPCTNTKLSFPI